MELIEVILSKENLNRAYKYKQYSSVTFLLFLSTRFLAHV